MLLQDAPLDAANFYSADIQGFGMFNEYGVPKKLPCDPGIQDATGHPQRIAVQGNAPTGVAVVAGVDKAGTRITILASNCSTVDARPRLRVAGLPWSGETEWKVLQLDDRHDLTPVQSSKATGRECLVEQEIKAASSVWSHCNH